VLPIAAEAIEELTRFGQEQAQGNAPRDLGGLQQDIAMEVAPLQGRVHIVGSSRGLKALVVERGRGPGKKMPPASALAPWAARHGIAAEPRMLFVIARAIGRRGIRGRFYMRRARTAVRRKMRDEVLPKMARQAEALWGR